MREMMGLLRRDIAAHRMAYAVCLLLGMVGELMVLVQPKFGGDLIAAVQSGDSFIVTLSALVAMMITNASCGMLQQILLGKICEDSAYGIRIRLIDRFSKMSVLAQESRPASWYAQRITSDVDLTKGLMAQSIGLLQAGFVLVGSTLALVFVEPLTFAVGAVFGCLSMGFALIASRPLVNMRESVQNSQATLISGIQEQVRAGRILRAYSALPMVRSNLAGTADAVRHASVRLAFVNSCLVPVASVLMQVANIGTLLFGALRVASGAISFSELIVFMMYFSAFSSSVSRLIGVVSRLRDAQAGADRVLDIFALQNEEEESCGQIAGQQVGNAPEIHFKNVSFSYGKHCALSDATFVIPAGKKTAIIGASGGGKTTCLGLLERFYAPDSGEILIDETPINCIDINMLRASIGYVDQESVSLSGTVRSNLLVGRKGLTDSDLLDALEMVGLNLSGAVLEYDMGENGCLLSGGQRQRVAIARSFLGSPKVLIMDEPTSSLDGIAEEGINELLGNMFPSATIVYTAHRLSLILSADWIVVLKEGRVVAQGRHSELLCSCEHYRELVSSQMAQGLDDIK